MCVVGALVIKSTHLSVVGFEVPILVQEGKGRQYASSEGLDSTAEAMHLLHEVLII